MRDTILMEGTRRPLPIGVDDFKKVREGGYYVVDKTELISDIIGQKSEVYLFTRPRRFGKSLNLSMIDCFFNMEYKGNSWFDGLKVMGHPGIASFQGTHPVIRIDMKGLDTTDLQQFISDFGYQVQQMFVHFSYILDSDMLDAERETFDKALGWKMDASELKISIAFLCRLLKRFHGVPAIVLIDEYDNPINSSFGHESYSGILNFLKGFYTNTLKGNKDLDFAVVTGVMQIAKESIFSGLNNLYVNNVFSKDYSERYGFTSDEVREMCSSYGNPGAFDIAKEWYDGYRFGDTDIYNPWSMLNFIQSGFDPKPYWAGTSGNDIIDTLLDNADKETYEDLQTLGNGGSLTGKNIVSTVVMNDLRTRRDAIYSVLTTTGYLKAVPDGSGYALNVPNKEIYHVFSESITDRTLCTSVSKFIDFFDSAERNDTAMMERCAFSIFADHFQDWDLPDEGAYRRVIAGAAMSRCGRYVVTTEGQNGNGRADMIMRSRSDSPNIVIEFKKSRLDDEGVWESDAKDALDQIKKNEYYHGLSGRTIIYGIAMFNKRSKVLSEVLDL